MPFSISLQLSHFPICCSLTFLLGLCNSTISTQFWLSTIIKKKLADRDKNNYLATFCFALKLVLPFSTSLLPILLFVKFTLIYFLLNSN